MTAPRCGLAREQLRLDSRSSGALLSTDRTTAAPSVSRFSGLGNPVFDQRSISRCSGKRWNWCDPPGTRPRPYPYLCSTSRDREGVKLVNLTRTSAHNRGRAVDTVNKIT